MKWSSAMSESVPKPDNIRSANVLIPTPETHDDDAERLFAEARRYPLLTAQEEREIDTGKWGAIARLRELMPTEPSGRVLLQQWCEACLHRPPASEDFSYRQHYALLRRELAELELEKGGREQLQALSNKLCVAATEDDSAAPISLGIIPPGLTIALAHCLLDSPDIDDPAGVAAGLHAWRAQWPATGETPALAHNVREDILKKLIAYKTNRDQLINHNLRLVYSVAGRYRNKGVSFLDLVQEGVLGLLRAAEKYDHSKGFRFSTYAFNWISQAIRRCINETAGAIRHPSHVQEQLGKLYKERSVHWSGYGKEPKDSELAETLGISSEKTRSLLQLRNFAMSVDTPVFDDGNGVAMLDTLPGGPFKTTSSQAEQDSLSKSLLKEIEQLEPAERQVVISRWGLEQQRPLTRAEIADQLSVSREWIRQLECSALGKLRRNKNVGALYLDDNEVSTR